MIITTEQTQAHANVVDKAMIVLLDEIHYTLAGLRQERKRRERANSADPNAQIDIEGICYEIDLLAKLRDAMSKAQNIGLGVRLALRPCWSTLPSA